MAPKESSKSDDTIYQRRFVEITDRQQGYDPELWQILSSASEKIDCFFDILPESESPKEIKALMEFLVGSEKNPELRLRIITNITQQNLPVAKELLKHAQVFHLDGVASGSFYIIDEYWYLYHSQEENEQVKGRFHRALLTTNPKFIALQQFLFDSLLSKATPARQRLSEIVRGTDAEFIRTLSDPAQILNLSRDLVRSSAFEVLVLFSTMNSFYRAENAGILDLLGEVSKRGVNVKVLVKIEDEGMKYSSRQKIKERHERISVAFVEKAVRSRVTTLIVDQTYALAIEVADDAKDSFFSATGMATYSNSESTVFTYYSMFENLWVQAELEQDSKIRQAYFHMFKEHKLKDEIYRRQWTFDRQNKAKQEE